MLINEKLEKFYQEEERREALDHRDVLLAISAILKQPNGVKLVKYLFKNLEVAELPDRSLEDKVLHESLGFLRAGNSIFKLVCEADPHQAASILSQIEREKYDRLREKQQIEHEFYAGTNTDD